ncbi:MAG: Ig-like domain-containing protein [Lachnospiraceae bacterium]|nr:Ig-like domain-containing protein [Lachnospiraceae bacterium]
MKKESLKRRVSAVFLASCLALSGLSPYVPFVATAYAEDTETLEITPDNNENLNGFGTMEISLEIAMKDPETTDFTYTGPTALVYDGSDKTATVEVKEGVYCMGEITVHYYSDSSRSEEVTETKNAGTYYVGITTAEGERYNATSSVLYDTNWSFTVTKSTPDVPAAPTYTNRTKDSVTLTAIDGYEYKCGDGDWQESNAFTGLTLGTTYSFYQRLKETDNTYASEASPALTLTIADTYCMTVTLVITQADVVTNQINALPVPADVTTSDEDAITAAAAAYEELTAEQKQEVASDAVAKLEAVEVALAITKLPAADAVTTDNKEDIEAAREAYDALNADQKEQVGTDALDKLKLAEAMVTLLGLPEASAVTTDDKENIEVARAAYDALSDSQKSSISEALLKRLTDDEARLLILQVISEISAQKGSSKTYTGNEIQLISAPTTVLPDGYTIYYAVMTTEDTPAESAYSTEIPTGTDAGAYYVWYRIICDDDQNVIASGYVPVSIKKKNPSVKTAPVAKDLTYNGKAQELVTAGAASEGTLKYALGASDKNAPADELYSASIPTATNVGTYYVWYKVVAEGDSFVGNPVCLIAVIEKGHNSTGENAGTVSSNADKYVFDAKNSGSVIANTKEDISEAFEGVVQSDQYDKTAKHRYVSSNKKVAKVSKKGIMTAKNSGEVEITLEQKKKGEKWTKLDGSLHLYVQKPALEKKVTLGVSDKNINAFNYLKNTDYAPTSWVSTKPGVATVAEDGTITILKAGSTNIIAEYGSGKTGTKKKYKMKVKIK